MRYRIGELKVHATPKAEGMFQFADLSNVEFQFPAVIRTVLFIHCGFVQASKRGGIDYHSLVGRLYQSAAPEETGENHVGKLHVQIHDRGSRFEPSVEQLEWHPDGSLDLIAEDGSRTSVRPSLET